MLAWGSKVSQRFIKKLMAMCADLDYNPDHVMACIAFETAKTFSPAIRNKHTGAVGLIQFMPQTALALGTTTEKLERMTAVEQLDYVRKYFSLNTKPIRSLSDLYMEILWPSAIGKPDSYVLFAKNDPRYPKRYAFNAGLDYDKDGFITKGEASAKVQRILEEGRKEENAA